MVMKISTVLLTLLACFNTFATGKTLEDVLRKEMSNNEGTCVFMDCASGEITTSDSTIASIRYTPCSTFKIWNTLIGVECGIIQSTDAPFYTWDSIPRQFSVWNRDQTLKEAFQVSCVPAFQNLARKIGKATMRKWIDTLNYGDKDISSGIDDFWLTREGKKSIRISPIEQVTLIRKLINDELPFSGKSTAILRNIMLIEKTSRGAWYGKTGSGTLYDDKENQNIGWFVGYVTGKGRTYSFSCFLKGEKVSGGDAKRVIGLVLKKVELL